MMTMKDKESSEVSAPEPREVDKTEQKKKITESAAIEQAV